MVFNLRLVRGRIVRSRGALGEMLPSFVAERKRNCRRRNCHCADGNNLHAQYQISALVEAEPRADAQSAADESRTAPGGLGQAG